MKQVKLLRESEVTLDQNHHLKAFNSTLRCRTEPTPQYCNVTHITNRNLIEHGVTTQTNTLLTQQLESQRSFIFETPPSHAHRIGV